MSEEVLPAINAINRIYDNLWIGDVETASAVAADALQTTKIGRLVEAAESAKELLTSLRREAEEKRVEFKEAWVTEMFNKRLESAEISIDEAVSGVTIVHLSNLKIILDGLVGAREIEASPLIREEKKYRYVVISQPPRFEVKALLETSFHMPNFEDLKKASEELGLNPTEPESKATMVLRFFSSDEFVEVVAQHAVVRITMNMREPSMERVEKIAQKILEILAVEQTQI